MEVLFKRTFIKDFKKLSNDVKEEVREICISIFPKIKSLSEFKKYPFQKIKGFEDYYRIKIGNFRIGFKKSNHQVIFMKVLHRKDIYRHFP